MIVTVCPGYRAVPWPSCETSRDLSNAEPRVVAVVVMDVHITVDLVILWELENAGVDLAIEVTLFCAGAVRMGSLWVLLW